jgi:cytidylate kinase
MGESKRIMVVGHSGAGKDTACLYLASITHLRFAGTTSHYLARYVAVRLGVSEEKAYRLRHANRNLWHGVGNEIRRRDPALLIREALEHAEITGGIRARKEIEACRSERLVDLIVWIANDRVPKSTTVQFDERDCDVVVANHGSIEEFHSNLLELARSAGFPLRRLS